MKTPRLGLLLLSLLVVTPFASAAQAAVAVLERLAGNPTIYEVGASGARTVSLPRRGAEYRLPIEIETGPDDSATFRLPDSEVSVAPNSVMRVAAPEPGAGGLFQRIFQRAGASLFSVDRRTVEHFQVETPYLVSVVKGTTFNVVVHDEGATVSLHEGRLQVTSVDGLQRVMLRPGDVAYSGRDGELRKLEHSIAQRQHAADGQNGSGASGDDLEQPATPEFTDMVALQESLPQDGMLELEERLDLGQSLGRGDLGEGADDLIGDVGSQLPGDVGGSAGDIVEDVGSDVGGLVGGVVDTAGDLLGDVTGGTGQIIEDVGGATGDLLTGVGDTTGDLLAGVGGSVGELTGEVGGSLSPVVDDVTAPVGDLTGELGGDPVGDLTGDLGDAVGDLTGDLVEPTGGLGGLLGGGLQL